LPAYSELYTPCIVINKNNNAMTNETKNNYLYHKPLTTAALQNLQQNGYKYLQVQGFTMDHHAEHVAPHYLMLVPVKELSANMDIYEPIDSDLISEWANGGKDNDRLEVYLAGNKNN
jgi:hypothetical protein